MNCLQDLDCQEPLYLTMALHFHQKNLKISVNRSRFIDKSEPYHQRSNGRMERCSVVFKRAIKKANGIEAENKELQEFLSIYRITPNPITNANMSPAELMFARQIRSIFDELILSKEGNKKKKITSNKTYSPGEKYFLNYILGKAYRLKGIIEKRTGT